LLVRNTPEIVSIEEFEIIIRKYYRRRGLRGRDCIVGFTTSISAISWQPVLVVEEAGVYGENHRSCASNW
jgi:hypothetical protein